jgi:hypothetical protein
VQPDEPREALALQHLDCSTRMFLVSLCLADEDLSALGFLPSDRSCGPGRRTAARAALHRILVCEPALARRVADLLDLRHLEQVAAVRAEEPHAIEARLQHGCDELGGEALAAWSWALFTDGRREVYLLGRRLMGECFVRAMGLLAAAPARESAH